MHLASYLELLERGSQGLARSLEVLADGHAEEADVHHLAHALAPGIAVHRDRLAPYLARYDEHPHGPPERLHVATLEEARSGGLGLLRDLLDVFLVATAVQQAWVVVTQAAKGARDADLVQTATECQADLDRVLTWVETRMKAGAPQTLLVAG